MVTKNTFHLILSINHYEAHRNMRQSWITLELTTVSAYLVIFQQMLQQQFMNCVGDWTKANAVMVFFSPEFFSTFVFWTLKHMDVSQHRDATLETYMKRFG